MKHILILLVAYLHLSGHVSDKGFSIVNNKVKINKDTQLIVLVKSNIVTVKAK